MPLISPPLNSLSVTQMALQTRRAFAPRPAGATWLKASLREHEVLRTIARKPGTTPRPLDQARASRLFRYLHEVAARDGESKAPLVVAVVGAAGVRHAFEHQFKNHQVAGRRVRLVTLDEPWEAAYLSLLYVDRRSTQAAAALDAALEGGVFTVEGGSHRKEQKAEIALVGQKTTSGAVRIKAQTK